MKSLSVCEVVRSQTLATVMAVTLLGFAPLRAQLVPDGSSLTLSNVTNAVFGTVTVGTNGSFTTLILSDNVLLTNSANGVISQNSTASSNQVQLISPSARWFVNSTLFVGSNGPAASLLVSNGASLRSGFGRLGWLSASSNNLAVVTGAGSTWSNNSDIRVGISGSGNRLIVSDGGVVADNLGSIGGSGSNNLAVVTGAGSVWSHSGAINIGSSGAANVNNGLMVENGGLVSNADSFVGGSSGGSNNFAVVTGNNSRWLNRDLRVGPHGWCSLLVIDGGTTASRNGYVGSGSAASQFNTATVADAGSLWSNQLALIVGNGGSNNVLVVTNGGTVVASNLIIGWQSTATNNRMFVHNGASVVSTEAVIGEFAGGNQAWVAGAGSIWSNKNVLTVGEFAPRNQLVVSNGATVAIGGVAILGVANTANSNAVLVTGSGSAWLVSSNLIIGSNGAFNVLRISDGARVANHQGYIGANSSRNVALVTDTNSVWTNRSMLALGLVTIGNQLVISNGGGAHSTGARIGHGEYQEGGASGNSVLVHGAGSYWSNSGSIYIGFDGDFNRLIVTNGGRVVSSGGADIGYNSGPGNPLSIVYDNSAIVSGPGSLWSMGGGLNFGHNGRNNRLQVDNGGKVISGGGLIGDIDGFNNSAIVTGSNSAWINTGALYLGRHGSEGNSLTVTNGGLVSAPTLGLLVTTGTENSIAVNNGSLIVTNSLGTGSLDLNGGSMIFNAGWIDTDQFNLRSADVFTFNRGTLITGGGTIDTGSPFIISAAQTQPRVWQIRSGGGELSARGGVIVGTNAGFANNLVQLNGGTLRVTNATTSSTFDLRRGTNQLNSGVMEVDRLLVTNTAGMLEFNGGTLRTRSTTLNNGRVFIVGDGANSATLEPLGGTHSFANHLVVAGNATLAGSGTINGNVTNFGGISPGLGSSFLAGTLFIKGNLKLHSSSALAFELGGLGLGYQDEIVVTNFAELSGVLSVSLINGFYPSTNTSLTLMRFASFSGQFANVPLAGARISTPDNLASFFVRYTPTSVIIEGAQYVDSDSDGMSDIHELLAGTDPNDPNSVLKFTSIARDPLGRYAIQFQSVDGKSYRVEYANDLTNWQIVSGAIFTQPATNRLQWIDDGSLTGGLPARRAYRIRLQ